ncbi:MAG: Holliday junction resolvase RuvX [Candidatus Hydrogenedentes bacterium]|nr:Holliday junction resolvase RuvX [Candidatus Hydrogenedentota bacterium]
MGLDIGEARTGIARSDALQIVAFPYKVVRAGTESDMARDVAMAIQEVSPVLVVAGLPLNQNGEPGPQAAKVKSMVDRLRALVSVEIITQDERFSTAEALRVARDMNARSKARKGKVDQVAAALILQTYLDRRQALKNTLA